MNVDTERIVREELEALKNDIIQKHIAAGQRTTGRTASAFSIVSHPTGGALLGANYSGVLERGRKPGKTPYNFSEIIKKWIIAKGLTFTPNANETAEEALNRYARAIAWKIKKQGSRLHRDVGSRPDIFTTATERFTIRLAERYAADFSNKIFKL